MSEGGLQLPGYAEEVERDGERMIRCVVCGNEAPTLALLKHERIYQNDLVADGGNPTKDAEHDLLQSVFAHSLKHPADWEEWRKTLVLFALAEGADQEIVKDAHAAARADADVPSAVDELVEAQTAAEEYIEQLPLPGDDTDGDGK